MFLTFPPVFVYIHACLLLSISGHLKVVVLVKSC